MQPTAFSDSHHGPVTQPVPQPLPPQPPTSPACVPPRLQAPAQIQSQVSRQSHPRCLAQQQHPHRAPPARFPLPASAPRETPLPTEASARTPRPLQQPGTVRTFAQTRYPSQLIPACQSLLETEAATGSRLQSPTAQSLLLLR